MKKQQGGGRASAALMSAVFYATSSLAIMAVNKITLTGYKCVQASNL